MESRQDLEMVTASPAAQILTLPWAPQGTRTPPPLRQCKAIALLLLLPESRIPDTCIHCVRSAIIGIHREQLAELQKVFARGVVRFPAAEQDSLS